MRLIKFVSWMLLCGSLAFVASATAAESTTRVAGRIIAAKVQGTVVATNLVDQTQKTLTSGDALTEKYEVKTEVNSSVILVFSNGATANVGADSTLVIEEFLMDPFAGDLAVADMTEEPTTSKTTLNLTRGELVGNVKKLKGNQGSTFTVNTPVGAAGIRGTTFRIVFRPDANGRTVFTLSTSEGVVLLTGEGGDAVSVSTGTELSVDVDVTVDAATGEVTITAPPVIGTTQAISTEAQASIAAAVQQIVETAAQVIISSSASTPPPSEGQGTGGTTSDEESEQKRSEPSLTQPTTNNPRTTSAEGGI